MMKSPRISAALQEKHRGKVVVSLNGKVLGIGKDSLQAVKNAKKVMPNIEDLKFLVSRVHGKILVA